MMKEFNVRYFELVHSCKLFQGGKKEILWKDTNHFVFGYKEGLARLKEESYDPRIDSKGNHRILMIGNFRGGELSFDDNGLVRKEYGILVAWAIPKTDAGNYLKIEVAGTRIESLSEKMERMKKDGEYVAPKITLKDIVARMRPKL